MSVGCSFCPAARQARGHCSPCPVPRPLPPTQQTQQACPGQRGPCGPGICPPAVSAPVPLGTGWGTTAPVLTGSCPLESRQAHSVPRPLPEVSLSSEHSEAFHASSPGGCSQEPSAWAGVTEECAAGSSVTMSTQKRPAALEDTAPRMVRGRPRKVRAGCASSRAGPRGVGRGQLGLCCREPFAASRPVSR